MKKFLLSCLTIAGLIFTASSFTLNKSDNESVSKVDAATSMDFYTDDFSQGSFSSHVVQAANLGFQTVDGHTGLSLENSSYSSQYLNYAIWKIDAPSGSVFKTLTCNIFDNYRFRIFDGDQGTPTIYATISNTIDDAAQIFFGYMYEAKDGYGNKVKATTTNQTNITFNFDTRPTALDSNTVYVTIAIGCDEYGIGYDYNRVCLGKIKFSGTVGSALSKTYTIGDNWQTQGTRNGTVYNLTSHGNVHGAVVGSNMTDPMSVNEGDCGHVTYEITAPDGETIQALSINATYRMHNYGSDDQYWGDKISVYYSFNGTDWAVLYTLNHLQQKDGQNACHYFNSLYGHAFDKQYTYDSGTDIEHGGTIFFPVQYGGNHVFIRFEMRHERASTHPINEWSMCFYGTGITYKTDGNNYQTVLQEIKDANTCTDYNNVDTYREHINTLSSEDIDRLYEEYFVDRGGYGVTVYYKIWFMTYMKEHNGKTPSFATNLPTNINSDNTALISTVIIIALSAASLSLFTFIKKKKNK